MLWFIISEPRELGGVMWYENTIYSTGVPIYEENGVLFEVLPHLRLFVFNDACQCSGRLFWLVTCVVHIFHTRTVQVILLCAKTIDFYLDLC